ncbi:TVP38/TMEM64 family protein [Catenisphaera adipataccumulans]|uniref:TVP38/TMEM64 family membrane protein n=1 Tax=Catenisphaera adipataccumulans TaxID=700500 RepID=A0A7W8CVI0_9FIRM|nr:VTT domain-containing protein [Catenisphaera adipataccumulans]MBB5182391.1 putative membrane protein YdjX (TVP38/TMEM64 family) [Catenisphaera adipataccumulans]
MKKKTGNRLIGLVFVLVLLGLLYLIWHFSGDYFIKLFDVLKTKDETQIAHYVREQGIWKGVFSVFMLSVIQVISIFIPGIVIQVSAGVIYSWYYAFLICYAGFVAGNALVFGFAKLLGKGRLGIVFENDKAQWLMEKINMANPKFVVGLANLIPGIPNGIIPYVASGSDITFGGFVAAVAASSWIQIVLNCFLGHFLIRGQYFYMVLAIAAQIVLIVLVSVNQYKLLKKKN